MKKRIILIDGMAGAGKTTVAALVAKKFPRTAIIGMDRIKTFVSDFERGFRDNSIARKVVLEMTKKYLELGLSVIIEHPFRTEDEIKVYEKLALKYKTSCYKFQLFTTPDIALKRITQRQKELERKVPQKRIKRNISFYRERSRLGFEVIDTTDIIATKVANIILNIIK